MKKLLIVLSLCFSIRILTFADTALIQLGPDGRPLAVPIPNSQPAMPEASSVQTSVNAPTSVTDTGSLPPLENPGYIYYTVPIGNLGSIKLITPWSVAILAEGYDFIGKESITQGYVTLASFWKVTGVFGAGINGKGEGSPMGGAIVNLVKAQLGPQADFNIAVTGGYNFNAKHALAVLSGSVKFLK